MPERRFLIWSVLVGLVIISSGHPSLGNPLVGPVAAVINGPASAFRNLWKFDPLIRLPVALGLAHLLTTCACPGTGSWRSRPPGPASAASRCPST